MTDITEELARAIAPELEGGREFDRMPPDKVARRKWHREGMCGPNDATQEDAREVVGLMLPIIARREREAAEAMRERCAGVAADIAADTDRSSDKARASVNLEHQFTGSMLQIGVGVGKRIESAIRSLT